jgi:F-type H+-transporting ATPase subunit b
MSVLARVSLFLAEEGEETYESHHWWLPETKEIIWGGLAFLIIAWALWKFAGPPIRKAMAARTERIQKQLDDSAKAKADAEAEVARVKASLRDLSADKAKILDDARATAERMRVEGFARNDAEVVELETRSAADIEAARGRVQSEVSGQVATLSADAAERIVRQQLDDQLLRELVEQYIANVGAAGGNGGRS